MSLTRPGPLGLDIRAADWAEHAWTAEWNNCNTRFHHFICNTDTPPSSTHIPRRSWVRLNHLNSHWCWTISLIPAQLGNGPMCGLLLWCWESNCRAYNSSLSPVLSTLWDNWIGPPGWWHNHLAAWILPGHFKRSYSYERWYQIRIPYFRLYGKLCTFGQF